MKAIASALMWGAFDLIAIVSILTLAVRELDRATGQFLRVCGGFWATLTKHR
jgi:hypothetical protein